MPHCCAVPTCTIRVSPSLLMCRAHWFRVPESLRSDVYRTWRQLQAGRAIPPGQSPWDDYERARGAAITAATA